MLEIKDLELAYDQSPVLQVDELSINQGEIGCILGPSGSGKSSFLRAICGLFAPRKGIINIDDAIVLGNKINLPASKRSVGMVFQDLCLFPHMTVAENIGYGLFKLSAEDKQARIDALLNLISLQAFADRHPYELSGGQQQRVAIARAIAPRPKLLLMDEPFSSLDPALREQLAYDLRDMLKSLNITSLIVTHDQREAFALGDKLALFANGKCIQSGSAYDLYHQPANATVAKFIGESSMLAGRIMMSSSGLAVETALGCFKLSDTQAEKVEELDEVEVMFRPDDIIHDDASSLKPIIIERQFRGAQIMFKLMLGEHKLSCLAPSHHNHKIGESFGVRIELAHVIVFKKAS